MAEFGYTAMCEQTPVRQLVSDLAAAEKAGFDFFVMSDHYFPWIEEQGHSGYAWSVLGAAAQATVQMPRMTFSGEYVQYSGEHFEVEHARLFDTGRHLAAARQWIEAGFTHLALVQVGAGQQAGFMEWAESEFLPERRKLG